MEKQRKLDELMDEGVVPRPWETSGPSLPARVVMLHVWKTRRSLATRVRFIRAIRMDATRMLDAVCPSLAAE